MGETSGSTRRTGPAGGLPTRCSVCNLKIDPVLPLNGLYTHPCCDPLEGVTSRPGLKAVPASSSHQSRPKVAAVPPKESTAADRPSTRTAEPKGNTAGWIRIELSPEHVEIAERRARARQDYAVRRGFKVKGFGSYETNLTGCLGEIAVALYEQDELDPDWTWEADVRRGHDIAGWQVRTRTKRGDGLNLHAGDTGRFILVHSFERPVMWLAGWIDADEGLRIGKERHSGTGDTRWWEVPASRLAPLPEKNGHARLKPHTAQRRSQGSRPTETVQVPDSLF